MSWAPTEGLHAGDVSEFCLEGFQPKLNDLHVDPKTSRVALGGFIGSFWIQGLSEITALPEYSSADTSN